MSALFNSAFCCIGGAVGTDWESIEREVKQQLKTIKALPEADRKKKISELRLRWHPDKNQMLQGLACEVTKLINQEL